MREFGPASSATGRPRAPDPVPGGQTNTGLR